MYENELWQSGYRHVCGVDEAGRGPLAGPVVAAAVILPQDFWLATINDSKKISESLREKLFDEISEKGLIISEGRDCFAGGNRPNQYFAGNFISHADGD